MHEPAVFVASRVSAGQLPLSSASDVPAVRRPSSVSSITPRDLDAHDARAAHDATSGVVSAVQAFSPINTDASPQEIELARRSAERLLVLFPKIREGDDVCSLSVRNFDMADVVIARGLSCDDADLNPDPALAVPHRVVLRVVERQVAPTVPRLPHRPRKRCVDDSFVPRRSARIAGLPAASNTGSAPVAAAKKRRLSVGHTSAPTDHPGSHCSLQRVVIVPASSRPLSPPTSTSQPRARKTRRSMRNGKKADKSGRPPHASSDVGVAAPSLAHDASISPRAASGQRVAAPSSATFDFVYRPVNFERRRVVSTKTSTPLPSSTALSNLPDKVGGKKPHHLPSYYAARRAQYFKSQSTEAYCLKASPACPAVVRIESTNRTEPGWRGYIQRRTIQDVLKLWGTPRLVDILRDMHVVAFLGLNTFICDMAGRGVVFRSTPIRDDSLIESFCSEAVAFARAAPVKHADRAANPRGNHFFCIAGVHRQYAKKARKTRYQLDNEDAIASLFRANGPARRVTNYLTSVVEHRFPAIAERMKRNHAWHLQNTRHDAEPLTPQFGLFWNFCINAPLPEHGIERVFCRPHADQMNCAILICALFVFWPKDCVGEEEWSWLVIWELGIILQCPRGSFILYPSALFFHFNVRIVKCAAGEAPTPDNSTEIPLDWRGGRGSAVWFTQASMHSVTDERDDKTGHYPDYDAMARKHFPVIVNPDLFQTDSTPLYVSEL